MRIFDMVFQGKLNSDEILKEAQKLFGTHMSSEALMAIALKKVLERVEALEEKLREGKKND